MTLTGRHGLAVEAKGDELVYNSSPFWCCREREKWCRQRRVTLKQARCVTLATRLKARGGRDARAPGEWRQGLLKVRCNRRRYE
jgi:hypothetical protein